MPTSQIPNTTNKTLSTTHPPPTLPEPLPCPRCDSTNTKFCYYNNYNLSQPRHFCKSCRRYWTHGGSLRNIPVGGSTRKAVKPRRASSSSATSTVTTATTTSSSTTSTSRLSIEAPPQPPENCLNLNENMHESDQNASFMSLLSSQVAVPGFGFGSSLGFGLCEMGIGVNWPYNVGNDHNGGGDTWQVSDHQEGMSKDDVNNGLVVDEESCGYFGWPELAIATPGTSLK